MAAPSVHVVAAVARNGVIGRDNGLIWHLSSDLKRFKALTMGRPVLMGRKTHQAIGRPLPGRRTLVLTRDSGFAAEGVETVRDWEAALRAAAGGEGGEALMVVGGGEVYALALPHADRLHLTEVDAAPEGDAVFPAFDRARFREVFRQMHPAGARDDHAFAYVDLERVA